jgi:iron complex outermembrane receptor protein
MTLCAPGQRDYGPSKIGGYMNFVPKTARAANGTYATEAKGDIELDLGSWGRKVGKASITGPARSAGTNLATASMARSRIRQLLPQRVHQERCFPPHLTPTSPRACAEFGGTYQKYNSVQNSGWNRVTQDLINNGTYVTGQGSSLDTSGDGKISRSEAAAANGGRAGLVRQLQLGLRACQRGSTACFSGAKDMNPHQRRHHASERPPNADRPERPLNNTQKTAYFDLTWQGKGDLKIKNQLFYDGGKNLNENAYGFSQAFNSYVIEDKIVVSDSFSDLFAKISQGLALGALHHFHFADDYGVELWNRPDITGLHAAIHPPALHPVRLRLIPAMSRPTPITASRAWSMWILHRPRFHRRHPV